MVFRERGIYFLPNGRELIVIRHDQEGSVLFSLMGEFVVNEAGRLVYEGN